MSKEDKRVFIRANKPLLLEYFGYDADVKRAKLSKKIATRKKLREAGFGE